MITQIATSDERYLNLKHELDDACGKFSKYFLALPVIDCRITCSKNGYRVHIKLKSGGREYVSERLGAASLLSINSAVDSILRMMESGGNISLLKGDKVKLNNIVLRCREV